MSAKNPTTLLLSAWMLIAVVTGLRAQVGINNTGASPHTSAGLDINYSDRGFLPPRMTTAERNLIASPTDGLQIFNTSIGCPEYYFNGLWFSQCGTCPVPASPAEGAHVPAAAQITWNWSPSGGATGYKWNTVNNYSGATDIGNVATLIQTGLSCGSSVTIYLWAYSPCGSSASPAVFTSSTTACPWSCGAAFTVTHSAGATAPVSKTVTYGTVSTSLSGATKCWITQNLGADQQATSVSDATEASAGWHWQFNRKQGYKHDGAVRTPNTGWITIDENSNWTAAEDPCTILLGSGWRIPTSTEWTNADASGAWSSPANTYASVLKLHLGGFLAEADGSVQLRGSYTSYWTSTQSSTSTGYRLKLASGESVVDTDRNKRHGFSVRCLKD